MSNAQNFSVDIQHLSIDDGLSNRFVRSCLKDSRGFMWFGTDYGLNRYDGHSFKNYTNYSHKINRSSIWGIFEDNNGYLWLVFYQNTRDYLIQLFDPIMEQPIEIDSIYPELSSSYFDENPLIAFDQTDQEMFFLTQKGTVYRISKGEIDKFNLGDFNYNEIIGLPSGGFVLKRWKNIEVFDSNGIHQSYYKRDFKTCKCLLLEKNFGVCDVAVNYSHGLDHFSTRRTLDSIFVKLNIETPTFKHLPEYIFKWDRSQIKSFEIRPNEDSTKWFIVNKRLAFLISSDGKNLLDSYLALNSLKQIPASNFAYLPHPGLLWRLTDNGLHKITLKPNLFKTYLSVDLDVGNNTFSTRGILPLEKGKILVNTYKGSYLVTEDSILHTSQSISKIIRLGLHKTPYGIFSGIHGTGIYKISNDLKKVKLYRKSSGAIKHKFGTFPLMQVDSTIWMGTINQGLFKFSLRDTCIRKYHVPPPYSELEKAQIHHFWRSTPFSDSVWIFSSQGLFIMDIPKDRVVDHFSEKNGKLPFNNIYHAAKAKQGQFWLATRGEGLLLWDPVKYTHKQYTTENGLSNNVIYAVYKDSFDNLWLPSNFGLMQFHIPTNKIRVFTTRDGLPHNEFNYISHFRDSSGNFYFGGLNGFISFNPKDIMAQKTVRSKEPLFQLTSIRVFNPTAGNFDEYIKAFWKKNALILQASNPKAINIKFALLDYLDSGYSVSYRLDNTAWIPCQENQIQLNSLPYGKSSLYIKVQKVPPALFEKIIHIPIKVRPPFYLRLPFLFVCLSFFTLGVIGAVKYRTLRLKKAKLDLEKKIYERTQTIQTQKQELEALNQTKDQLLAIIAHDTKGPALAFTQLSDKIRYLLNRKEYNRIDQLGIYLSESAHSLQNVLDNLLYWALHQRKKLPYHPRNINLKKIIDEALSLYSPTIHQKQLKVKTSVPEDIFLTVDFNAIQIIIRNIISNAIKFSPHNEVISIDVTNSAEQTILAVKDNGIGIPLQKQKEVFDQTHLNPQRGTYGEKGTGIGLAVCKALADKNRIQLDLKSELGQGTTFFLIFKFETIQN